jgi:large subunit ribosomal protein L21e
MQRTKGIRKASRNKLRKRPREKGMPPITRILRSFKIGDKVSIKIEPSVHKGMPHHRYQGITGKVVGKRGDAYEVEIKDLNKTKLIISRPVHLARLAK